MNHNFFIVLTTLTGLIILAAIVAAYKRSKDTFHPLIYLGAMLFFFYCLLPLMLVYQDLESLMFFLSQKQLEYVQTLNLLGAISLILGVLSGDKKVKWSNYSRHNIFLPSLVRKRIQQAAVFCGWLGVIAALYTIAAVGGFQAAYGRSYGGGWAASGYIREAAKWLSLPGLIWFMITRINNRITKPEWGLIIIFSLPLILRGLLGGRRGPFAILALALLISWYFVKLKRPSLIKMLTSLSIMGILMIMLVLNRSEIYLGSDFNIQRKPFEFFRAHHGNEYVYGSGVILNSDATENHYWGKRYFTQVVIRAIPRAVWPNQYQDAASWLGIPNLERSNAGVGLDFEESLGWTGGRGASPGIIADVWVEFQWLSFLFLFGIGRAYGVAWRKSVSIGGVWIPIYILMASFSVYLVAQTFGAVSFRFLFAAAPTWLIWKYGIKNTSPKVKNKILKFVD